MSRDSRQHQYLLLHSSAHGNLDTAAHCMSDTLDSASTPSRPKTTRCHKEQALSGNIRVEMMRCDQVLEPTLRFSLAKAMSYFSGLHKLLKKVRPQKG